MVSILYCLITNDQSTTPLASVTLADGNFPVIAQRLIPKIPRDNSVSYAYQNEYMFHCHNSDGLTLLCMTEHDFSNRKAYSLLFDLKDRFLAMYGDAARVGIGYSAKDFASVMRERMQFYASDRSDSLSASQQNLTRAANIMQSNLDKVIERGVKITVLLEKTESLSDSSVNMRRHAVKVRKHMWWKNFKVTLILAGIIIVSTMQLVILFIVFAACGFSFQC